MNTKYWLLCLFSFLEFIAFGQNIPPAPSNFRLVSQECGKVTLAWDDYNEEIAESDYTIYMSTNGENGYYQYFERPYNNQFSILLDFKYRPSGEYFFKIQSSVNSVQSYFTDPLLVNYTCAGPTNLVVANSNCGNINLSWSAPIDGAVSQYEIFKSDSENGNYTNIGQVAGNIISYNDNFSNTYPSATSGKPYFYKVKATKNGNQTAFTNTLMASFQCTKPSGFTITNASCGKVNLVWDQFTAGQIEILKADNPTENFAAPYLHIFNSNNAEDNSFINFNNSKTYYYKIRGKIGNVYTEFTSPISTQFQCPTIPILRITSSQCGEVKLSWDAYPGGTINDHFIIYRYESPGLKYSKDFFVDKNTFSITDTEFYGYQPNTTYSYKLAAIFGNTITEFGNFVETTFVCDMDPPNNVTVTSPECAVFNVSWNPIQNSALTGYEIRRGYAPEGPFYQFKKVDVSQTNYTDNELISYFYTNNYHYEVSGLYNNINSNFSPQVSTSLSCAIPTGLGVTNTVCNEVNLTWDNYPTGTNYNGYILYYSNDDFTSLTEMAHLDKGVNSYKHNGNYPGFYRTAGHKYKIAGKFNNGHTDLSNAVEASFTCPQLQNFRVTQNNCEGLKLEWDNLGPNAKYWVYQALTADGYYYHLNSYDTSNDNFYLLTHRLEAGKTYYFKIEPYLGSVKLEPVTITATYTCAGPQNLRLVSTECGKIKIAWDNFPTIKDKIGIRVHRSINGGSFYPYGNTIYTNEFEDKDYLQSGKTIAYKVRSFYESWNEDYANRLSAFGNEVSTSFTCDAPTNFSISKTSCGGVTFTSDSYPMINNRSSTFNLFRSDNGINGIYNQVQNGYLLSDNSLTEPGKIYYYKLQAKIDYDGLTSNFTEPLAVSYQCEGPNNLVITNVDCENMKLTWEGNYFLYDIYISKAGDFGKYTLFATTYTNNYTFTANNYNYFLEGNLQYYFKVKGKNYINKYSEFSNASFGVISCNIQSPTNLKSEVSDCNYVKLSWDAFPANPNTYIAIYRSENGENGNYQYLGTVNSNVSNYFDRRINNIIPQGNTLFYRISAYKLGLGSAFSNTIPEQFNCNIPSPIGFIATQNCNSVLLSWSDYPAAISEQGYIIYKRFLKYGGAFTRIGNTSSNVLSFLDNSYTGDIESLGAVQYKIVGIINNATGEISNESVTIETTYICPIVQNTSYTTVNCKGIKLNWADFNGINESGYIIYKSHDNQSFYELNRVAANVLTFNDYSSYGFAGGQKYYYKIAGIFNYLQGPKSETITVTFQCAGPTNLTATSTTCGKILLQWDYPINMYGFIQYSLFRSTTNTANSFVLIKDFSIKENQYIDGDNILSGQTYYYKLKTTYNSSIEKYSDFTNVASSVSNCSFPAPQNLVVSANSCGKISLSWSSYTPIVEHSGMAIFRRKANTNDNYVIYKVDKSANNYDNISDFEVGQNYEFAVGAFYNSSDYNTFNTAYTQLSNKVEASFTCPIINSLAMVSASCANITLAWQDLPDANEIGYEIWRSKTGVNGTFLKIGTTAKDIATFTDNTQLYYSYPTNLNLDEINLAAGFQYIYKIRPIFNNILPIPTVFGEFSNTAPGFFQCEGPQNLAFNSNLCENISITWEASLYQNVPYFSYFIFRSTNGLNGEYNLLKSSRANIVVDNTAILGQKYYYKIKTQIGSLLTDFSTSIEGALNTNLGTIKTGQWTDPTTWSCGRLPTSLDEILINNGHKVTIGENLIGNAKTITNNGELEFGNNVNLILHQP